MDVDVSFVGLNATFVLIIELSGACKLSFVFGILVFVRLDEFPEMLFLLLLGSLMFTVPITITFSYNDGPWTSSRFIVSNEGEMFSDTNRTSLAPSKFKSVECLSTSCLFWSCKSRLPASGLSFIASVPDLTNYT